jgi:PAS domain S-box-containing protein
MYDMSLIHRQASEAIRILHVDDDIDFAEMATAFVEREDDRFETETAGSASDGLTRLANSTFDCVISDYDMPRQNGIEFLETVREEYPELPFILHTGKGSEEVASDAISAGATDYLQKESGTDHFSVLANRVKTVVERTRAERQRQQLTEAIETAREGIGIIDSDGYHTAVNQAYADTYSTRPSELAGKHWTELYPENEAEHIRSEVLPTVDEVGYWRGRTTGLRADGETFVQDCVVSATEQGTTICAVQDVSDEAESEEQLSRYQALIEVLKDPVYVLDGEGQFDFVNDALTETFGYERQELLGNGVSVIKDEQAVEQGLNNLRRVLSSDEPDSVYFETEIQSKNGESIPCEDHMTALPYEGDEFNGSVGILRDVSRQKEREQELRRRNRRLDEFASIVSHDLRNPLNVAVGNVELLREECDSDRIDTIEQSLTRMSELIDDLLQLSRVGDDTESMESVSLAELPNNCWQSVETGDATLQTRASRTIRADPSRLAQLFENLMRNAIEHTNQDVTVTVGELEGGFYIEDDGSGIPEDSRDDVVEAGHTTADKGTGFGLSIVKEVAEAHGWEVSIAEGSEGGARFEITNVEFETS